MSDDRHDAIRARAYQLWEEEGRPDGRHADHWHEAARAAAPDAAATIGDEAGDGLTETPAQPARAKKAPPQTVAAEPAPAKKPRATKPRAAK